MLKKWKIKFKSLSPVHIKGQKPNYGMGIIVLENDSRVGYIVDRIKWSKFLLKNKSYLNDYLKEFSDFRSFKNKGINDFLKKRNLLKKEVINEICSGITHVGDGDSFICDGNKNYYIPGTSIKGAIRTALLFHFLKERKALDENKFNNLVKKEIEKKLHRYSKTKEDYRNARRQNHSKEIRKKSRELDRMKKSFAQSINEEVFMDFLLNMVRNGKVQKGPNTDILRTIKVSDAKIANVHRELVKPVCFKNNGEFYFAKIKFRDGGEKPIALNCDCLLENTEFEAQFLIDFWLLSQFYEDKKIRIDNNFIRNAITEFGSYQWKAEKEFFQKVQGEQKISTFYNQNISKSLLRIGWGTGMLGTTINLLFQPPLRQEIRNVVMGHNRPGLPAPHSKRIIIRNNLPSFPLGWVMIDEFEEL